MSLEEKQVPWFMYAKVRHDKYLYVHTHTHTAHNNGPDAACSLTAWLRLRHHHLGPLLIGRGAAPPHEQTRTNAQTQEKTRKHNKVVLMLFFLTRSLNLLFCSCFLRFSSPREKSGGHVFFSQTQVGERFVLRNTLKGKDCWSMLFFLFLCLFYCLF